MSRHLDRCKTASDDGDPPSEVLAVESLVLVGMHVRYREVGSMILSGVLGLAMAFIAYGRQVLVP